MSDDDVVEHRDAQQPSACHQVGRHRAILRREGRITAGVIVDDHDRSGARSERLAEDVARVNDRRAERAAGEEHHALELQARSEENDVAFLDREVLEPRRDERGDLPRGANGRAEREGLRAQAAPELERGDDRRGAGGADRGEGGEAVEGGARELAERVGGCAHYTPTRIDGGRSASTCGENQREEIGCAQGAEIRRRARR